MSNAFKDWIIANMPPMDEIDGMAEENERLKQQLAELPKKICNDILKEADKCFYADPQSETPLTRKALKVILHQIQQKYTKEFENDNT